MFYKSIMHQQEVATFWDLFMLAVQCYKSNSPESRDSIRLEVGPSLVCLAIGKIYERSSVSAESIRYFCKVKLTYGRERAP